MKRSLDGRQQWRILFGSAQCPRYGHNDADQSACEDNGVDARADAARCHGPDAHAKGGEQNYRVNGVACDGVGACTPKRGTTGEEDEFEDDEPAEAAVCRQLKAP